VQHGSHAEFNKSDRNGPSALIGLERFCKSCGGLASRHSVFHQVEPLQRGHMIDQTGLEYADCPLQSERRVPCQGMDVGDVIAKHSSLSDFAFRPTPIFNVDKFNVDKARVRPVLPGMGIFSFSYLLSPAPVSDGSTSADLAGASVSTFTMLEQPYAA